ncbi:hypothetical protein BASA81_002414 [Batrachochytrium salamandrivorans]|nr:hypothetical protein BASA81_002414 [Batrachochytrium salamandrivorans]
MFRTLSFTRRRTTSPAPTTTIAAAAAAADPERADVEEKYDEGPSSPKRRTSLASSSSGMTLTGWRRRRSTDTSARKASTALLLFGHFLRKASRTSQTSMTNNSDSVSVHRLSKLSNQPLETVLNQTFATEDMARVNAAIVAKRRLLIRELLGVSGDSTTKISFIDAVDQYLGESEVGKKDKMASTICSLFIQGDMFKITSLGPELMTGLEKGQFHMLEHAKLELLAQLSLDKGVMDAVAQVELADA